MTACFDWWHLDVQDGRRAIVAGDLLIDAVRGSQKNSKRYEGERGRSNDSFCQVLRGCMLESWTCVCMDAGIRHTDLLIQRHNHPALSSYRSRICIERWIAGPVAVDIIIDPGFLPQWTSVT